MMLALLLAGWAGAIALVALSVRQLRQVNALRDERDRARNMLREAVRSQLFQPPILMLVARPSGDPREMPTRVDGRAN